MNLHPITASTSIPGPLHCYDEASPYIGYSEVDIGAHTDCVYGLWNERGEDKVWRNISARNYTNLESDVSRLYSTGRLSDKIFFIPTRPDVYDNCCLALWRAGSETTLLPDAISPHHAPDQKAGIEVQPCQSAVDAELEEVVTQLFIRLSSDQEPLGIEFEKVLFDNLWDLYES